MARLTELQRGRVAVSDLRPSPRNPRRIGAAALRALQSSVERFGLVQEIVVNRRTGHVVGGHQRLVVLRELDPETSVPVVWVDLDERDEAALNAALNSPLLAGTFDDDALAANLGALDEDVLDTLRLTELLMADTPTPATDRDPMPDIEYRVIVDCRDEKQQLELLERLAGEGLKCRALIS